MLRPLLLPFEPALLIGQPPGQHSLHRLLLQHLIQVVLVHRRHIPVLLRHVLLRKTIVIDIELGDEGVELALVQLLHKLLDAVAQLHNLARTQVRLDPHGLDRCSRRQQPFN